MINSQDQQKLLLDIARRLKKRVIAYAIGGTAMMFLGLKGSTKDIDLVFEKEEDRKAFQKAAEEMRYAQINPILVYGIEKQNLPVMLARGKGKEERFDLFLNKVISFHFSEEIKKRAENTFEFGDKLELKIADPHDVIAMKCTTDREKDRDDAIDIINKTKIDWDIILAEAINQRKFGNNRAVWFLAEFVDDLILRGVKIPNGTLDKILKAIEEQSGK